MALADRIKEYIAQRYLGGDGVGLEAVTPLLELNVVDSAGIFDLMWFLSNEVPVVIPLAEVTAQNFGSIDAMVRMVERLTAAAEHDGRSER